MKYNFDEIIERKNTDSMKWSNEYLVDNFGNADALPFWVADMDFKTAQPIIDAIVARAKHGIYGYAIAGDEFYEAITSWQMRRNNWEVLKEWILFSPGIVPALGHIVKTFCEPGDNVIIQSPVYYPFYGAIKNGGCNIINNKLLNNNGRYEIDFDDLETKAKDAKMMILCSPHNPVGRVWSESDIRRICQICKTNDVLLIADEIHSDLIHKPHVHTAAGRIAAEAGTSYIVCTAPSKTFNLAGIQTSCIIVPDTDMRKKLSKTFYKADIMPNVFALAAMTAAYNNGEEWLDQLLEYLEGNITFIETFVAENMPKVKFQRPEGTYLAWLDFEAYGWTKEELKTVILDKANLALDDGYIFGDGGETCQRINFACPRSLLKKALESISKALKPYAEK